jgi:predicted N-formylglutamate amidohydrolase
LAPAEAREQRSEVVATANSAGTSPFLILCDHASNHIPPEYRFLGLGPKERSAHIAWDPGALEVARRLAQALDAALVHSTVSRLVIDCNRPLDAPDLIAAVSETTPVPSNAALGEAERQRRIESVHVPYHRAIERLLAERLAAGRETFLVALHSFTPVYRGIARPWQVGVIFDRDRRLADPLIAALKADGLTVGVNEPYSPADRVYYTLTRHGEARGLPAVMIEIRNDLIADEAGQREWAERLARALAAAGAAVHAG